jgi:acyl-CoA thioesterase-1
MAPMKKQILVLFCAGACVCLGGLRASALNIMPEGDSVTARGDSPESSYRYWLWQDLQNAGFTDVTFVGNQNGVSDGTPANTDFDQHYEGGDASNDAWGTQDGIDHINDAANFGADIVLLDLGSNDYNPDIGPKASLAQVQANLETIINGFAANNPSIIVLLAQPTPWVTTDRGTKQFMSGLGGAAAKAAKAEMKAGVQVVLVNIGGGFSARRDTKDGEHPNVQGEQKIANKYFQALKKVFKKNGLS